MKNKKFLTLLLAALMAAGTLASCGESPEPTGADVPAEEASAGADAAEPAPEETEPAPESAETEETDHSADES